MSDNTQNSEEPVNQAHDGTMMTCMEAGTVREFSVRLADIASEKRSVARMVNWLSRGSMVVMVTVVKNGMASAWVYAPRKGVSWLYCHVILANGEHCMRHIRVTVF